MHAENEIGSGEANDTVSHSRMNIFPCPRNITILNIDFWREIAKPEKQVHGIYRQGGKKINDT